MRGRARSGRNAHPARLPLVPLLQSKPRGWGSRTTGGATPHQKPQLTTLRDSACSDSPRRLARGPSRCSSCQASLSLSLSLSSSLSFHSAGARIGTSEAVSGHARAATQDLALCSALDEVNSRAPRDATASTWAPERRGLTAEPFRGIRPGVRPFFTSEQGSERTSERRISGAPMGRAFASSLVPGCRGYTSSP